MICDSSTWPTLHFAGNGRLFFTAESVSQPCSRNFDNVLMSTVCEDTNRTSFSITAFGTLNDNCTMFGANVKLPSACVEFGGGYTVPPH
jgi:hypothetical protein